MRHELEHEAFVIEQSDLVQLLSSQATPWPQPKGHVRGHSEETKRHNHPEDDAFDTQEGPDSDVEKNYTRRPVIPILACPNQVGIGKRQPDHLFEAQC